MDERQEAWERLHRLAGTAPAAPGAAWAGADEPPPRTRHLAPVRALAADPVPVEAAHVAAPTTPAWSPVTAPAEVRDGGPRGPRDAAEADRDGPRPAGEGRRDDAEGTGAGAAAGDPHRAGVRWRDVALDAAVTTYTAAHGHPLDHPPLAGPAARRWAVTPRVAAAAVTVLVLLAAVVAGRTLLAAPPMVVPAASGSTGSAEGPAPPSGAGAEPAPAADPVPSPRPEATGAPDVVVHVVGQVVAPGLVHLPAGSRVADAVAAAGGATAEADVSGLNLARVLVDGEQVLVPRPGEAAPVPAAPAPPDGGTSPAGPLDLNTADLAALDALPGVGPVLAQRILDWRAEHGRFSTVDELAEVSGIGPRVLDGLRDLVRVG